MIKEAWFLFSIENNYDQPENNLVSWWAEKPSLDLVSHAITNKPFGDNSDEDIVKIVHLFTGQRETFYKVQYRLQKLVEGPVK